MAPSADRPFVRVVTAAYPGPTQPRRAAFIERLHRELAHRYRFEILAPRVFRKDPEEETRHGLAVRRFEFSSGDRPPRQGLSPLGVVQFLRSGDAAARALWREGAGDGIVLAHWAVPAGWIAARVAERLGVPLVIYGHGSDLHRYGRRLCVRRVAGRVLRQAARVVVASGELATLAKEIAGGELESVEVIPVGIDPVFEAEPTGGIAPPPPLQVLFVGDLLRSKGFDLAREGCLLARREGADVELEVVGTGPLGPAVPCRIGPVTFRGDLSAAEVRARMEESHLLLLPSRAEGTPLVVQEAIAVGLPVVATPVGGIPDLFRDRGGWIPIEPRTAEAVRQILRELAPGSGDSESGGSERWEALRRSMKENSREGLFIRDTARALDRVLAGVVPRVTGVAP